MGLAHKRCNHKRSDTPLSEARLVELVRIFTDTPTLPASEAMALLYRPLVVQCDEFVIEVINDLYYLCRQVATNMAKYNEVEGWSPKCDNHTIVAKKAGAQIMRWSVAPRELQWRLASHQAV